MFFLAILSTDLHTLCNADAQTKCLRLQFKKIINKLFQSQNFNTTIIIHTRFPQHVFDDRLSPMITLE